jgi:chitinase
LPEDSIEIILRTYVLKAKSSLLVGLGRMILVLLVLIGAVLASLAQSPAGEHPLWVCAYYLAGMQDKGPLTPQKIDFTAITHLIHFGIFANGDGTIDSLKGGITPEQSKTVVTLAHAAGCKVLVCLGTDEKAVRLRQALSDSFRRTFVHNLVQFVVARGYDGVDIDMEPLEDADVASYAKFIEELRTQLIIADPNLLLTAAVASEPALFARLQIQFDQINLMTYDLSGPWPGFQTWYNASLYDGGPQRMNSSEPFPSVQGMVQQFVQAGVSKAKLGIGVAFYGYVWSGATGPRQSIQGVKVDDSVDYHTIMDQYFQPKRYHWDAQAQAPYLSIASPQFLERKFISYDDATLCTRKIAYVRQQGLGGLIIWELGGGYRDNQQHDRKDALLQSIKRAWRGATQDDLDREE